MSYFLSVSGPTLSSCAMDGARFFSPARSVALTAVHNLRAVIGAVCAERSDSTNRDNRRVRLMQCWTAPPVNATLQPGLRSSRRAAGAALFYSRFYIRKRFWIHWFQTIIAWKHSTYSKFLVSPTSVHNLRAVIGAVCAERSDSTNRDNRRVRLMQCWTAPPDNATLQPGLRSSRRAAVAALYSSRFYIRKKFRLNWFHTKIAK